MENKVFLRDGEEYLTLNVLLKIIDVIPTGGMAKIYLAENYVVVNGEKENRRGRKLYEGDKVVVEGKNYIIARK